MSRRHCGTGGGHPVSRGVPVGALPSPSPTGGKRLRHPSRHSMDPQAAGPLRRARRSGLSTPEPVWSLSPTRVWPADARCEAVTADSSQQRRSSTMRNRTSTERATVSVVRGPGREVSTGRLGGAGVRDGAPAPGRRAQFLLRTSRGGGGRRMRATSPIGTPGSGETGRTVSARPLGYRSDVRSPK